MKLVTVLMNVIFRYCIMKCVNIWKVGVTQWTDIFQMTKYDVVKLWMGKRSIHNERYINEFYVDMCVFI